MSPARVKPRRREIWLVDVGQPLGKAQGFHRPALIVSADRLNSSGAELVIVIPLTRSKKGYPTHVEIDPDVSPETGLNEITHAQTENIRVAPTERLVRALGALPMTDMSRVEAALRRVLAL